MSDLIPAWPAPAKINLFLHIIGRRSDGYHEIQTLFQLIDLCDELQFEVQSSRDISRHESAYEVPESDDLTVRAAKLLQAKCGVRRGVRIRVNKRIPLGAGLGGGSSDAATTLVVLNSLWGCGLSLDELAHLARALGADIPLFIKGRTALAAGIGEILKPVKLGQRHYLLVFNPYPVSTAEVFSHPDLVRDSEAILLDECSFNAGRNDCEDVVIKMRPELGALMTALAPWGEPHMTGTGSCIFLPMPDEKTAVGTALELKCRYNVRAVRGLDKSPLHEMLGLQSRNE